MRSSFSFALRLLVSSCALQLAWRGVGEPLLLRYHVPLQARNTRSVVNTDIARLESCGSLNSFFLCGLACLTLL